MCKEIVNDFIREQIGWRFLPMPKNAQHISKEAYLVPAPKARLYRKVLAAKCLPWCAEGLYQGKPLSPRKSLKNVLGTRLEGTFECKAHLENAELVVTRSPFYHPQTSLRLALRHSLPVQRQILRTGHVLEKIVQNLCAGHSRQVPGNLCERCAGASENVLRLCEICAGVHLRNLRRVLGWGFRECACTIFAQFFATTLYFFSETKLYGQKMSQAQQAQASPSSLVLSFFGVLLGQRPCPSFPWKTKENPQKGKSFLLTARSFLLTVGLCCLQ